MQNSQQQTQPFKITMLGPSGVGKTTLLTVMRKQMNAAIDGIQLRLNPGDPNRPGSEFETMQFLNDCEIELSQLVKSAGWVAQGGLEGTGEAKKFYFHLGDPRKKSSYLLLEFQDYPGGWIEGKDYESIEEQEEARQSRSREVVDFIKESRVTILVIDTPALIEKKGKYHAKVNKSEIVKEILLQAFKQDESRRPRLLIFAPVKCEKYVQGSRNESRKIEQNIRSQYEDLLNTLNTPEFDNVATVITPVQTVGNVLYSHIEESVDEHDNPIPKFMYHKTNKHELEPVDAEQPLRYILRFALKSKRSEDNDKRVGIVKIFRDFFGLDKQLEDAIEKFGSACKSDGLFVRLINQKLL